MLPTIRRLLRSYSVSSPYDRPMVASAPAKPPSAPQSQFAGYQRVEDKVTDTRCLSPLPKQLTVREWQPVEGTPDLEPVDILGKRMFDAILRVLKDGPAHGIRLTGDVDIPDARLACLIEAAAGTRSPHFLEALRSYPTPIRSFTVTIDLPGHKELRADLRTDCVVIVDTPDKTIARQAAVHLLECALGIPVAPR